MADISDKTKTQEQLVEELRGLRQRDVSDGGHPVAALERRSTQLQIAAEVSRAISSILNLDALIPQVVDLVRERFGLYYAGLFLVDGTGERGSESGGSESGGRWAVLRAGTGEAGRQMLDQGHRLEVGGSSMVGWCIASKQARIALDVGEEAVRFKNPWLPDTRSELALPLVSRGQAIGALTIQSTQEGAFSGEDVVVLQVMADQLANGITNARLYEQAQREIIERKEAEERLAEERSLLRTLIDTLPDYIFVKDAEARFVLSNVAHLGTLGVKTQEDVAGKTDLDIFPPELAESYYADDMRVIQTGEALLDREEPTVNQTTGRRRWLSTSKVPLQDTHGNIVGLVGMNRDITERKQAEAALANRLRYEEGLAACSQALLGDAEDSVLQALHHLLVASDSSRVYVFENFDDPHDGLCMRQTHEACALGVTPEIDNPALQHLPYQAGFARWQEKLAEDQPIVGSVKSFPQLEREILESQDILSILVLPIWVAGEWYGFVGFDDTVREREWGEEDVWLLVTAAGMIGAYIERKQAEAELRKAHEELERYTDSLERRTAQLHVGAEVAREAAVILDVNTLLNTTVRLISERFSFYHAGAFLVDEQGEYAVLRAASSAGGKNMLARGHKLQIGKGGSKSVGIVGYVAATGEPRIAHDVGQDAVFFNNPDLPNTRSEMALPLKIRGRVIGVLDVQSTQEVAFSEDDVAVLQTLADQLAVAVENARLMQRTEAQLRELNLVYGEYTTAAWTDLASSGGPLGYVYDRVDVVPIENLLAPALDSVLESGLTVALDELGASETADRNPVVATPLKLRDQIIGALGIQGTDGARQWSPQEIALVEAVGDQVAQALESARLFAETRKTAQQMQVLNELGQALATRLNVHEVLEETYIGASQLLDTTNFYIALRDIQSDSLSFPLMIEDGRQVPWQTHRVGAGLAAHVVRIRQPVLITEDASDWLREMEIEWVGPVPLSWLGVPLVAGDQVLGVIAVQSTTRPRTYDEQDQSLLTAIASQAAIALQNAYLFEEVQRRATQLAAAAEVARDATAILDVDQLLEETVQLISKQFGFYHAGVFLLDERGEYAVLRAASSEGGKRMLARDHKLRAGKVGIVGYVAGTGESRVALDVGKDATHFAHSDLPDTRSEMALPLKVHGQVIGVLDVQSTEEVAFSDDDVAVLQTLADQLAAAIANARLFQEVRADATRRALINEVQRAATMSLDPDELLHQAGEVISRRLQRASALLSWDPGAEALRPVAVHDEYAADVAMPVGLEVVREMGPAVFSKVVDRREVCVLEPPEAAHPDERGSESVCDPVLSEQLGIRNGVYVPLTTRDQLLGVLALSRPDGRLPEGQDFLEIVTANVSVALENARLYQEAVKTAERLVEMDRLKSQFLANMSHELRTPLNSIIGFSRVILKGIDGPLTDMQRTDLQAVYDSGQHLLGLINDILDISKIQAGKMELSFEDVDLREIIKGVRSTAIALVKDKPIELQQVVPDDLPMVRADPRRIRQVLLNVVGNAAKFTEEGFIRMEAEVRPKEVLISVSDTGIGIPADKLETVFEEFTQVDGSSTRRAGGTGLGLSITRHFVEMHGGRIWVESTFGVGSNFYVALPIEGPSEDADRNPPGQNLEEIVEDQAEADQNQKVVLCVDDDQGVITLFRRYLSKQGYHVVGLTSGAAVAEKAQQIKPFAITLDVMMPDKDGWQVIQDLKANPETCHIPVIMCTIVGEKEHGLSLGASDYLLKPILEDDLVAALEQLDPADTLHPEGDGEEGRHRVLVVDDQVRDRKLLRRMIEACGRYEVVEAPGGQEAITLVREVQPHVIILDLMMPDMDGFAVLEAVKADKSTRSIPIIVVTAKTLTQDERDILNRRVETLLQKGLFEQQDLLADVAAALEKIRTDGE